jgi:hypothetical protein
MVSRPSISGIMMSIRIDVELALLRDVDRLAAVVGGLMSMP